MNKNDDKPEMVYEDDVIAGTMGGVLTQTILQHSNQ